MQLASVFNPFLFIILRHLKYTCYDPMTRHRLKTWLGKKIIHTEQIRDQDTSPLLFN